MVSVIFWIFLIFILKASLSEGMTLTKIQKTVFYTSLLILQHLKSKTKRFFKKYCPKYIQNLARGSPLFSRKFCVFCTNIKLIETVKILG